MSDISKCNACGSDGKICSKKDTCFRYLATDSQWQSYFLVEDVENCTHYWEVNQDNLKSTQRAWDD